MTIGNYSIIYADPPWQYQRSKVQGANHSQVDWTNNKTIHDRISQDIDDLFYDYEKERGLKLSFDTIDKIIENVKTVALRRF